MYTTLNKIFMCTHTHKHYELHTHTHTHTHHFDWKKWKSLIFGDIMLSKLCNEPVNNRKRIWPKFCRWMKIAVAFFGSVSTCAFVWACAYMFVLRNCGCWNVFNLSQNWQTHGSLQLIQHKNWKFPLQWYNKWKYEHCKLQPIHFSTRRFIELTLFFYLQFYFSFSLFYSSA